MTHPERWTVQAILSREQAPALSTGPTVQLPTRLELLCQSTAGDTRTCWYYGAHNETPAVTVGSVFHLDPVRPAKEAP